MSDSSPDATQVAALARTRRLATGVLAALAAVFVATHLVGADTWSLRLIRSMAEAGMVGGLADWFAVEALFRHPLGLPIPHTALLPANQARAARNVGRFFEAHFLDPALLDARLRRIGISRHAADWLTRPGNALALAQQLTTILGAVVRQDPPPRMLVRARAWLRAEVMSSGADAAIARSVAAFVKAGVRSTVVDEMLALIRTAVDDNRDAAVALVHDRSRWWIAKPVDRRVAGLAVDGVLSLLDELRSEDSSLRRDFRSAVDRVIDGLAEQGALEQAVADARRHLVRTGTIDTLALRLAGTMRDRIAARIDDDPDAIAAPLAALIGDLAARLQADPDARADLDARIAATAAKVIADLRPVLGGYVADVIANWQPDELIARFEAQIGPDLQFIRINGAVLGALIGGLLYGFGVLLD
jgi:uncharacterized membrane-anchored protein YjiN (DUF445 family)